MSAVTAADTCSRCSTQIPEEAGFCPQCGSVRPTVLHTDDMVGRWIIGQYVIRQQLGVGGMGVVYLADQPSVGRVAVVKVMHPELSRDPQVAPRFEVEARAASQLNHPHIVTIYNHGAMEEGPLFLAMEHCAGISLEGALRQGPLGPGRAAAVGQMIADALCEAHRRGVVHRDLKPSNIMLTEVGRRQDFVKVLDFGIAKLEGVEMTRTGMMIGTPQYMSPEQFRGEDLDGRSDLYSLGVMLFEMVAGRLPFISQSLHGYMHKHLTEAPPSLTGSGLGCSPELERIVSCLLAKDAAHRFADAAGLMTALERCPELGRAPDAAVTAAPAARSRVGLGLGLAAGVVALASTALALVLLLGGEGKPAEQPDARRAAASLTASVDDEAPKSSGEESPTSASEEAPAGPGDQPPITRPSRPAPKARTARAPARARPKKELNKKQRPTGKLAGNKKKSSTTDDDDADDLETPKPYEPSDSVLKLEKRLRKVMSTARIPPSSVDQTVKHYRQAMARVSPWFRDVSARNYLRQLILTYKGPTMQLRPHERKSLAQMTRIYLTMETKKPMSETARKRAMNYVLKVYDQPSYKPRDRSYHKRAALLHMIKEQARDPKKALGIK